MKSRNWVWGLFFVCAAALIVLNQLGMLAGVGLWSLVLTVGLAAVMLASIFHLNFFGIIMPLAFIAIIYAEPLNITALTPWPVLVAAAFLSIGLSIIFRKRLYSAPRRQHFSSSHAHGGGAGDGRYHGEYRETVENISDNDVSASVTFGASVKYLHADNLERANFSCSFGSLKVYFDQATLGPNGAQVNVNCSFGEIKLFVPINWRVEDQTTTSLGDVEYFTRAKDEGAPTIYLTGSVSLGSVEVVNI